MQDHSPIAVLFVHGVQVADPRYADTAVAFLRDELGPGERSDGNRNDRRVIAMIVETPRGLAP